MILRRPRKVGYSALDTPDPHQTMKLVEEYIYNSLFVYLFLQNSHVSACVTLNKYDHYH